MPPITRPSSRTLAAVSVAALLLSACAESGVAVGPGTTAPTTTTTIPTVVPASPLIGLEATVLNDRLDQPVAVIAAPDDDVLWVAERTGRVVAVDPDAPADAVPEVVLDLRAEVEDEGPEQGLLSLAVHPGYPEHGGVFVYLVTAGDDDTELREYQPQPDDLGRLDPDSAEIVLSLDQPHEWHNGGGVVFGPDGYLYLGLGDGGGIGDQYGNAQDPDTLLGSVLRLDVDAADPYAVPPDNPFLDGGGAPEVWVHGLRNPWRIAIDPVTSTMVIADVGQDVWEDINVVDLDSGGGLNFGWPVIAGPECFQTRADREAGVIVPGCDPQSFELPLLSLGRDLGCAVIGGPVYRGAAIPELHGHYTFADYCRGTLRSFPLDEALDAGSADQRRHLSDLGRVTSLGADHHGELLVTDQDGTLYRIDPVRD